MNTYLRLEKNRENIDDEKQVPTYRPRL